MAGGGKVRKIVKGGKSEPEMVTALSVELGSVSPAT